MGIPHHSHHMLRCLALIQCQRKPIAQTPDRAFAFERREASIEHKLDSAYQLLGVWSNSEERLDGKVLEELVSLGVPSAHQYDHLMVEFERVRFEFDTLK